MISSPLYLLDTNTVSYIVGGRSHAARRKLTAHLDESIISVVTEAELRYGLARKPEATKLSEAVESFLAAVQIRQWDSQAARAYASLRAQMTASGKTLSALDMMIAAHAVSLGSVLVTNDKAFAKATTFKKHGLRATVNWAQDVS